MQSTSSNGDFKKDFQSDPSESAWRDKLSMLLFTRYKHYHANRKEGLLHTGKPSPVFTQF